MKGMEQTKCKFLQLKQDVVQEESSEVTMLPLGIAIGSARRRGALVIRLVIRIGWKSEADPQIVFKSASNNSQTAKQSWIR